jgi:hypothetical protein
MVSELAAISTITGGALRRFTRNAKPPPRTGESSGVDRKTVKFAGTRGIINLYVMNIVNHPLQNFT